MKFKYTSHSSPVKCLEESFTHKQAKVLRLCMRPNECDQQDNRVAALGHRRDVTGAKWAPKEVSHLLIGALLWPSRPELQPWPGLYGIGAPPGHVWSGSEWLHHLHVAHFLEHPLCWTIWCGFTLSDSCVYCRCLEFMPNPPWVLVILLITHLLIPWSPFT